MLLNKMKSIIEESPRIVHTVTANFGEYMASWTVGNQSDEANLMPPVEGEPISRIAYIQMCGEDKFEVVLHDKAGNWFLGEKIDISGCVSSVIDYFKDEKDFEQNLLEVFPVGTSLKALEIVVGGSDEEKVAKPLVKETVFDSPVLHGWFVVVETDNDGRDFPLENFVGKPTSDRKAANDAADELNKAFCMGNHAQRFWKVAQLPYRLGRGMEDAV